MRVKVGESMESSGLVQKLLVSFCVNQSSSNNKFKQLFLFVENALIIIKIPWCSEF